MKILPLIIILFVCGRAYAQPEMVIHQSTHPRSDSRFEIIQSSIMARLTFKIDKFNGDVFQLVESSDSGLFWEEMDKEKHFLKDIMIPDQVNYQLFISGLLTRITLLMNLNTGATWQLVEDPDTGFVLWQPIR
ncbi:MAG: hypothetical protein ACFHWX_15710 [Bacteroidota bacterium]